MPSHKITSRYSTAEGAVSEATSTYSQDGELEFEAIVPISSYQEIDLAFPYAKVSSFMLYSSGALTLLTNTQPSGVNTISLAAGQQIVWGSDGPFANPFTTDVTKMYAHNASGTVTPTLKIRVLLDTTV